MKIRNVKIIPASFPLIHKFRTALGEKATTRNVWVVLETDGGISGIGEASGSLAMPESKQENMVAFLRSVEKILLNSYVNDWQRVCVQLKKKYPQHPTAISAIECAFLDVYCRIKKEPIQQFFGGKNTVVQTYFTIPALPLAECEMIARRMSDRKFRKFKVKVTGRNFNRDLDRVKLVAAMAEKSSLIVDANQGFTKEGCLKFMEILSAQNVSIAVLEQPVPQEDIRGLQFVNQRSPVPVAADESLRTIADAQKIVEAGAADIFNLKLAKCGLLGSLKIARYIKKMKKRLMIGCMMESKIGLATSVHWACGSGDFEFADLDSFLLLKDFNCASGFRNRGPFLSVPANIVGSGNSTSEAVPEAKRSGIP